MIDGHRVELDSNGNILPRDLRFAGPQPKICGLPYPDDGFICCESNALALAQAMANVSLADQRAYRHETKGHMAEWMSRDLNWNLVQSLNIAGQLINVSQEAIVDRDVAWKKVKTLEEEIADLRDLHTELTTKYDEAQDSVWRLEGSLKKERNQSTSRLTELESAQRKCRELERKIERRARVLRAASKLGLHGARPSWSSAMYGAQPSMELGHAWAAALLGGYSSGRVRARLFLANFYARPFVVRSAAVGLGHCHASSWLLVVQAIGEDELVNAAEVLTLAGLGLLASFISLVTIVSC
ncbi:hypothetical protein Dimus_028779 [Dionaea muscipula]